MADNTLALQVQPTQFAQNFNAGFANGQNQQAIQQQMKESALEAKQKAMQGLYGIAYGVQRDGEVNPEEWEQAMDWAVETGVDPRFVERLRGKPQMAKIIAESSLEGLRLGNDERALDLQFQKLAQEIEAAETEHGNKSQIDEILRKHDPELADAFASGMIDGPTAYEQLQTKLTGGGDKAPDIKTVYDPTTGRQRSVQWKDGKGPLDGWYPVGGVEAPKEGDGSGGPDLKELFGYEKDLWQQYSNSDPVKTYEAVKGGYERVRESAAQQSGAGDMAMLYGYMRMLDPGSVVRESEFAMAAQAGSFGEQVQGMVTKLLNGQRLPETQRKEFLANAEKLYAAAAGNLEDINGQFMERAGGYGVDPGRFVRQPEAYDAPRVTKSVGGKTYYQDENGDWFEE